MAEYENKNHPTDGLSDSVATLTPTIRECGPADLTTLATKLDTILRPACDFSLAQEYPLLFQTDPSVRHLIIEDQQGSLLSHLAILVRQVISGKYRLRIGMISNVVTREDHRGRGLAGKLVHRALAMVAQSRCAATLVWSDKAEFYAKFGFSRAGREFIFNLSIGGFPGENRPIIPMDESHIPGILSLHRRHPVRVERSLQELTDLLHIPQMETYVREDYSGGVSAYLCLGKGEDFKGVIHEFGGEPFAVEAILGSLTRQRPNESFGLILSPMEKDLIEALERRGFSSVEGALGLAIITDPEALAYFTSHLGPLAARFKGEEEYLPFHFGGLDSV